MDETFHQILLLFFIFPAIIHSKDPCPILTCGFKHTPLHIQYPFMLQTDHLHNDCHSFINLRCDDQGQVVINLTSSGDFYVTSIDYVLQKIVLTDPGNCLLGRLMMPNTFPYPLEAYLYKTYTYFTCRRERIRPPFTEVPCLSNSINATIVTTDLSNELMGEMYGCTPIASSMIPVTLSDEQNVSVNFGELQLTWNVPLYSGDSKSRLDKFLHSSSFVASAAVLVTFSGLACLMRVSKLIAGRAATANDTVTMTESSAIAAPQGNATQVKSFSEVVFLGENQGTLVSCSICLEEYNGKDRVRNLDQCGHYFHVGCIDEWLQKNSSCPVCRTTLY